jgi:hypothetical protein
MTAEIDLVRMYIPPLLLFTMIHQFPSPKANQHLPDSAVDKKPARLGGGEQVTVAVDGTVGVLIGSSSPFMPRSRYIWRSRMGNCRFWLWVVQRMVSFSILFSKT